MTWQQIIVLQVIASSVMTIWYRRNSLRFPRNIFLSSIMVYLVVAFVGFALSFIHAGLSVSPLPAGSAAFYVAAEGLLIPTAWLFGYKLLSIIGASSMAVAQTINFLTVAIFGIIFIGDTFNGLIILGGSLLIAGVILALTVNASNIRKQKASTTRKIMLLTLGSLALAAGLVFEKLAIDSIGVWDYAFYGWTMQLVGAVSIFMIFGRNELKAKISLPFIKSSSIAGLLTAISGSLFIYSLSKGILSTVILASSAKVALTAVLAFWILKERDHLLKRLSAMCLSIIGLIVIFLA